MRDWWHLFLGNIVPSVCCLLIYSEIPEQVYWLLRVSFRPSPPSTSPNSKVLNKFFEFAAFCIDKVKYLPNPVLWQCLLYICCHDESLIVFEKRSVMRVHWFYMESQFLHWMLLCIGLNSNNCEASLKPLFCLISLCGFMLIISTSTLVVSVCLCQCPAPPLSFFV